MSFAVLPKTKLTQQDAMSESWEDKYPNKCSLWLISLAGHSFSYLSSLFEY
ncbi:TPA: hypothetical protein ACVOYL_002256 [Vibrio diabolicus]|jgi:hypothetical protein